jgi:CDP-glucose 4,6-dehydratase
VPGSLFEAAGVADGLRDDIRLDIRDSAGVRDAVAAIAPDVVIHLAAQALVRESYVRPRETFEVNALGTLSVLEAVSATPSVRAHLVITTDKVYRNVDQAEGYVEDDPLGGDDPYSASKAMADILTQSYVTSFPGVSTAIARGGNVIGGGDVSKDRLFVDLVAAFREGKPAELRYPGAVRPWQHVLDCLNGYLSIVDALLAGSGTGSWNIGPGRESFVDVGTVAARAAERWGDAATVRVGDGVNPHEANLLALDATKAERELGWRNLLPFPASLEWAIDWYREVADGADPRAATLAQIQAFDSLIAG